MVGPHVSAKRKTVHVAEEAVAAAIVVVEAIVADGTIVEVPAMTAASGIAASSRPQSCLDQTLFFIARTAMGASSA